MSTHTGTWRTQYASRTTPMPGHLHTGLQVLALGNAGIGGVRPDVRNFARDLEERGGSVRPRLYAPYRTAANAVWPDVP